MAKSAIAPQIDFAKRHIVPGVSTFDAASALYRLDSLVEDASEVYKRLKESEVEGQFYPYAYEFTSYYLVGYVTCLEWHARSRLYDLYVFDPKTIDSAELKQSISESKVVQMLSENLTIAHLIAGSTNVSTLDKYISIFVKILDRLQSEKRVSVILAELAVEPESNAAERLAEMYEYRNRLVHEIDLSRVGPYTIRDMMHFDEVISFGELVKNCIKGIESAIRACAPADFPNLLDEDFYPIDEVDRLRKEIADAEADIGSLIDEERFPNGIDLEGWHAIAASATSQMELEMEMLNKLEVPGAKYYDIRPFITKNLLKQRLSYLKSLKTELSFDEPM